MEYFHLLSQNFTNISPIITPLLCPAFSILTSWDMQALLTTSLFKGNVIHATYVI